MATDASALSSASVLRAIYGRILARANAPTSTDAGKFALLKATKSHNQSALNTNGDTDVLLTFPQKCYLLDVSVKTSAALDSHATPTLENDIAVGTGGVVSATLVESATGLRGASGVIRYGASSTSAAIDVGYDVSGLELILTTDAAAATAGTSATLTVWALVYLGDVTDLGSAG